MDDQALVAQVQRGDARALEALVERYHPPLSQYLERLLGDAETAREVAQETFLRMMRAIDRYQPRAKFSTWLYTIATNLARDELRRRRTHGERTCELAEAERQEPAEPPPAVSVLALDQVEREDVRRALAALSDDHRTAIVLHFYQDLSYKEIAAACGCTVGTVGSRIHYAVKHLRRELGVAREED